MITTIAELQTRLTEARTESARVSLISTIGALHAGHAELIRTAKQLADVVVVSTFVNPLRFPNPEAAAAYPRSADADEDLMASMEVDIAFAPTAAELLPSGADTIRVSAGAIGLAHEGQRRPFYFDGLLTVEAILFHLVQPDVVVYGERDRQRTFLVQKMIRDLRFDIEVETAPTVRTVDGLPVSSRVDLLEPADRAAAAQLSRALEAAASGAGGGVDACIAAAQSALMGEKNITLEYLTIVDPNTFLPVAEDHRGPGLALVAATVADHRFIDNAELYIG